MEDLIQLTRKEYTIGWLCALPDSELIAARSMLDVQHKRCELPSDDENSYTYGSINGHNIVIACMPSGRPRTNSTMKLTQLLSRSFPNMRIHLFVGIGGGIPRNPVPENAKDDIHLGDVVVGWNKRAGIPSLVQCDFQRLEVGEDELLGTLDKPDRRLLNALTTLEDNHHNGRTEFAEHLKRSRFSHPVLLIAYRAGIPQPEEYHIPLDFPDQRDLSFKGREEIFAKIRKSFWLSNSASEPLVHRPGRQVVSLCGLDGSGKTHTALEYAYRYSKEYSSTFWFNATNKIELEKSARKAIWSIININTRNADRDTKEESNQTYLRVAHSLGLDGRSITSDEGLMKAVTESSPIKCLNHWLYQEPNSRWLLILDNYDDPTACADSLRDLLPARDAGHVLITSRIQKCFESCTDIEMFAGMERQEALELLYKISGKKARADEHQTVVSIVDSVGRLPLAIELIGAYLRKYSIPVDSYAESLEENLKERLGKLHAVCEISFRKLTREAKHMAQLLSLIGNEDIPYKLLEAGREVVDWMGSTRNALNKAIGELLSLSLLSERPDNSYHIHPLVHRWVRDYTNNAVFKNSLLVVDIVTSTFVFGDERTESQSAYQYRILPHIECCSEIFFKYLAPRNGTLINDKSKRIAYNLARIYTSLGNIPKSSAVYGRSLQDATGQPSCLDLKMMDAFGVSLRLQGEYDKALSWCNQALDGTKSQGGNDSPESFIIAAHIAAIFQAKGDYAEAITRYRWVLEQQEEKIGYLHPQTLETRHQLAGALVSSKEYVEAVDLLEQVQEEKEKKLGKYHPSVLGIIDNVATILEAQNSYHEALRYYDLVYESRRNALGENHYATLGSKSRIACVYEKLGRYDECLAQHQEVLKQLENIFGVGEDHRWILHTISSMADASMRLERYNEAETMYHKAHAGFKRLLIRVDGELPTANKIARLLRDQGKYQEALQWSEEAELGFQEEAGEDSYYLLTTKVCTASIHALEEDYGKALEIYEQVLKGYEKKHTRKDHAEALKTELSMGKIFLKQGLYQKALEFLTRAEKGLSETIGPGHDYTLEAAELQSHARHILDEDARQKQLEEENRQQRIREEIRQEEERKTREQEIEKKQKQQEEEERRRKQQEEEERRRKQQEEEYKRKQQEEEYKRKQQEEGKKRKRQEEENKRKQQEEENRQKQQQEEENKRKHREEENKRKQQEEEERRRKQEEERRRKQQEEENKRKHQEEAKKQREQEEARKQRKQEEELLQQEEKQREKEKETLKHKRKWPWSRWNCFREN
ncbi:uncharacterized protein DFL_006381 [Arthrobotrys flagrans]|uniref:Nucleoside phosphorylase domain-containing protein n=1 Tax=Arthrobotrys flagrans TaxID=97331 RepID=A0A437A0X8_ARTFL|nr:hypothetical protein DFL_006381 [Arthrobotrys flagrans]